MTHNPDQSQMDQAQMDQAQTDQAQTDQAQTAHPQPPGAEEISNVDLQFMGRTDPAQELDAEVQAQSKAPGEYEERGMDAQDVASAGSMIASDPASTSMPPEDER